MSDADRLARFEREARVLAALNHPNIATIYGVERVDPSAGSGQAGIHALVLEVVEGETLADRLSTIRAGLPLSEALAIARQIVEALEAAHEKGIVHRDLKPANIKIRPDGVGEGARLRSREAPSERTRLDSRSHTIAHPRRRRNLSRRDPRDRGLYVARAGEGRRSRPAKRHFFLRLHPLRAADGATGVRKGNGVGDPRGRPQVRGDFAALQAPFNPLSSTCCDAASRRTRSNGGTPPPMCASSSRPWWAARRW